MRHFTPNALDALVTPDLAHLGLLAEVVADIRQLDGTAANDAAFRSGARQAIDERLPPPPVPLEWPAGHLLPGSTPADAAGLVGGLLAWNSGPAARLLSGLSGCPVTIGVDRCACRCLTADEATALDADPAARAYERDGTMTAAGIAVARTWLLILQDRIPGAAWEEILSGKPAGEALKPYGMARDRRRAHVSRADATVDASAVLKLGTLPIGVAEEHVTAEFTAHLARMAGRP
jgi:hypothetical protein